MEERLGYIALEIEKQINSNSTLILLLNEYTSALDRVTEINGTIERSERADLIQRVLTDIDPRLRKERAPTLLVGIGNNKIDIGPTLSMVANVGRLYFDIIRRLVD
jgi:hypothetical protein